MGTVTLPDSAPVVEAFNRGFLDSPVAYMGRKVEKKSLNDVRKIAAHIISSYLFTEEDSIGKVMEKIKNYTHLVYDVSKKGSSDSFVTIELLVCEQFLMQLQLLLENSRKLSKKQSDKQSDKLSDKQRLVTKFQNLENFVAAGHFNEVLQIATAQSIMRGNCFNPYVVPLMMDLTTSIFDTCMPDEFDVARLGLACLLTKLLRYHQIKKETIGPSRLVLHQPFFPLLHHLALDEGLSSICEIKCPPLSKENRDALQTLLTEHKNSTPRKRGATLKEVEELSGDYERQKLQIVAARYFMGDFTQRTLNHTSPEWVSNHLLPKLLKEGCTVEHLILLAVNIQHPRFVQLIVKEHGGALGALLVLHRCCFGRIFYDLDHSNDPVADSIKNQLTKRVKSICISAWNENGEYILEILLTHVFGTIQTMLSRNNWIRPSVEKVMAVAERFSKGRVEFIKKKTGSCHGSREYFEKIVDAELTEACESSSAENDEKLYQLFTYLPEFSHKMVRKLLGCKEENSAKSELSKQLYKKRCNQIIDWYSKIFVKYPPRAEYFHDLLHFLHILITNEQNQKQQIQLVKQVIPLLHVSAMAAFIKLLFILRLPHLLRVLIEQRYVWHDSLSTGSVYQIILDNIIANFPGGLSEKEKQEFKNCTGHDIYSMPHNLDEEKNSHVNSASLYSLKREELLRVLKMVYSDLQNPIFGEAAFELGQRMEKIFL